mmetsp:Transcript_32414/g.50276  ORF Transcript_32414/g.50276 Transcript_32414/m.50276 type:complete len:89 (-) Transcript_32414:39-305(-)
MRSAYSSGDSFERSSGDVENNSDDRCEEGVVAVGRNAPACKGKRKLQKMVKTDQNATEAVYSVAIVQKIATRPAIERNQLSQRPTRNT